MLTIIKNALLKWWAMTATVCLLAVHEGPGFRGWQVAFLLLNQTACEAFVPCRRGTLPESATKEELLQDGWIKRIIAGP